MPSSGYTAISFTAGEQPTTAKWNLVGSNDASFNTGNGFNDNILVARHYANASIDSPAVASGILVNQGWYQTGAVATGTTTMPGGDTIPTNTQGDQYLSLSYTPKATTNLLVIEAKLQLSNSNAACDMVAALYQDSTTNALASGWNTQAGTTYKYPVLVGHQMTAGTTSATTFKVRAGCISAGTTTLNGQGGSRLLGGSMTSYIKISEYKV